MTLVSIRMMSHVLGGLISLISSRIFASSVPLGWFHISQHVIFPDIDAARDFSYFWFWSGAVFTWFVDVRCHRECSGFWAEFLSLCCISSIHPFIGVTDVGWLIFVFALLIFLWVVKVILIFCFFSAFPILSVVLFTFFVRRSVGVFPISMF